MGRRLLDPSGIDPRETDTGRKMFRAARASGCHRRYWENTYSVPTAPKIHLLLGVVVWSKHLCKKAISTSIGKNDLQLVEALKWFHVRPHKLPNTRDSAS